MAKHRAPLTFEQALDRIAGQLPGGVDDMARLTQRQPRTVRNWKDPDTPEEVPIGCAIALDLAFQAAGGIGAPLREAYDYQLEAAQTERFAEQISLGHLTAHISRETGEALAALVLAAQPGRTEQDRRNAEREVGEALDALKQSVPLLARPRHPP